MKIGIHDVGGYVGDWQNAAIPSSVMCLNLEPVSGQPATDRLVFRSGDNANLKQMAHELGLLSFRQLQDLFPDREIHREKLLV